MKNTYFVDADLVYHRPPRPADDDLVEIEFADMEPLDGRDLVGVEPLAAIATIDLPAYDLVGVDGQAAIASTPAPRKARRMFTGATPSPEELETEEYTSWPAA
jgi:hypothetical protein